MMDNAPKVDPGASTSEFWVTLGGIAGNIIAVAVMLGYVAPGDAAAITKDVTSLLSGLQLVVVNAVLIWKYIDGRQKAKSEAMQHETLRHNAVQEARILRQHLAIAAPHLAAQLEHDLPTAVPPGP